MIHWRTPGVAALSGIAALCLTAGSLHGAAIYSGQLRTLPETIYVNQSFQIQFELEVTPGVQLESLRISDFPSNPELIEVGELEHLSRQRATRSGREVVLFTAAARCLKPIDHTFHPQVDCKLTERRSMGFFSGWHSRPVRHQLNPFRLKALPLPERGRPAEFSGAVGQFQLEGALSHSLVRSGDIVTLTLELKGQGWLGETLIPQPPSTPTFKTYPARESRREATRVVSEQVWIPLSTNAQEIAAVAFNYFNPFTERYERSEAGPFTLRFQSEAEQAPPQELAVNLAETKPPGPLAHMPGMARGQGMEQLLLSTAQLGRVLLVCGVVLSACFIFFLLRPWHPRVALALAVGVLAIGIAVSRAIRMRETTRSAQVAVDTEARFTPVESAPRILTIPADTPITLLEAHGEWLRVDVSGKRGWIPASSVR